jgi:hypothetical protein
MMMAKVLIGIDDTDNRQSPGTGKLARQLVAELERMGGLFLGTTGHQFLVDARIPYTGHNRGICVAVDWAGELEDLEFVFDLVRGWSAEGSDPGVCLAMAEDVGPDVVAWGERALREVLTMEEAVGLAQRGGLRLRGLGGTGGGVIGALASVGLRVGGSEGRFVDLPGLRELGETVTVERLAQMGIELEYRTGGGEEVCLAGAKDVCKTRGWVRPRLVRGLPVLGVRWSAVDGAWVPVEERKRSMGEEVGHFGEKH